MSSTLTQAPKVIPPAFEQSEEEATLYTSFPEPMRKVALELRRDPEKARLFLVEAGIIRPEGGLTPEYS